MSGIQGKVGPIEIEWKVPPRGGTGEGVALVDGKPLTVRWRMDPQGLWLELPDGVYGFDLQAEAGDDGRPVYQATRRGADGVWEGLSFVRKSDEAVAGAAAGAKKAVRVRAQMPGKIIRIGVKGGMKVEKGQSLLVMEAMKMENEIRAPHGGLVTTVKVAEGQTVETGADLCMIDPGAE